MQAPSRRRLTNDRTLNRMIVGLLAVLVVGIPAIAITYYLDRHVDGGQSLTERAITAAEDEVRADPNRLSARVALAAAYANGGRQGDAVRQYDEVLAADAANRLALLGRADARRELGELDAAATDYQALVDIASAGEMAGADPQLEAAYYGLGVIALDQQRPRDAATYLAKALLIDDTDADALELMGQTMIALADYPAAVDALRSATALVPTGWCEPYEHLGQAYEGLPDTEGVAYAAGMVALCESRLDEAEQLLSPLVGGDHARDALVGLALTAEQRGDAASAYDLYQQVLEINPGDFAAITGLGRLTQPEGTD